MAEIYIPILAYHRIVDGVDSGLAVTPEQFAHQLNWLKNRGYVGVSMADAVAARAGRLSGQAGGRGGAWKNYKAVALTFDHGYADNFRNAFPILKEHGIPAHFFLVTGFLDTSNLLPLPGNPNTDPKRDRLMTWDEAMQLKEAGMGIGAMSAHHVDLTSLDAAAAKEEIDQSRDAVRGFLGDDPDYFSYPFGKLTPALKELVKDSGFRGAVYTPEGKTGGIDRYSLRRIGIPPGLSDKAFAFKVSEQADTMRENPAMYALMKAMGKAW
ncbi:MAG: polysaccharide deacetylase family protein [Candidatus Eisenbacteria bacterium]|nr:polysaccharide deacetylase family protein [Candidatus Eisenbacteria bacterium]